MIWRRRWLIVIGTLACALAALLYSLQLPKTYETNLDLKLGRVWEKPFEDPQGMVAIINSEPFLDKIREKTGLIQTAHEIKKIKMVVARVKGEAPLLVNIKTRANTPEKSVELAETTADLVIRKHQPLFDALMDEYRLYERELEKQVKIIQSELDALSQTIKNHRALPQVNAPAVILMQAQLEEKQSRLVALIRELRDVRIHNRSEVFSEGTRIVLPPVLPEDPMNPKVMLNILVSGVIGFMSLLMLAFFLEYIAQTKLKE